MLSNIASGIRTLFQSVPGMPNGGPNSTDSEFWQAKMLNHFRAMDMDGDGFVSRSDIKALVTVLTRKAKLTERRSYLMQRLMIQLWEDFWCCGEDKGFDYLLPPEEFIALMNALNKLSDCKKQLEEPLGLLFDVIDLDANGLINKSEWICYCDAIRISEKDAMNSFEKSFDGKQEITKPEFISIGQAFFTLKDERHSSQYLWMARS